MSSVDAQLHETRTKIYQPRHTDELQRDDLRMCMKILALMWLLRLTTATQHNCCPGVYQASSIKLIHLRMSQTRSAGHHTSHTMQFLRRVPWSLCRIFTVAQHISWSTASNVHHFVQTARRGHVIDWGAFFLHNVFVIMSLKREKIRTSIARSAIANSEACNLLLHLRDGDEHRTSTVPVYTNLYIFILF